MPNRLLRTRALTSRRLGEGSPEAEVLYYRLMLVADDFGRYFADTELVQSACYPRRERSVDKPFKELVESELIHLFEVDGESYLAFETWDQQVRAAASRFPQPPAFVSRRKTPAQRVPADAPLDGVGDGVGFEGSSKTPASPADDETEEPIKGLSETAALAAALLASDSRAQYLLNRLKETDGRWGNITNGAVLKLGRTYGADCVISALGNMREEGATPFEPYPYLESVCVRIQAERAS